MEKVDLKKELKHLYQSSAKEVIEVEVPFSEEGPMVEKVHQFIDSRSRRTGKHHEIYLSDIRKADPSKWKTVIRQPIFAPRQQESGPLNIRYNRVI